jgi:anti-sigma-K factor RskA
MSDKNIEELLNAFVDGEVSDRQATEVKRLMLHDPAVAAKVGQLQRQRQLLAALPVESAPADMAGSVRTLMERRTLLDAASAGRHHVLGSVHLFGRKLAAVAAMLALLGGLAFLVFKVVGPELGSRDTGIVTIAKKPADNPAGAAVSRPAAQPSSLELALTTNSPGGLNSVIAKAIDSCGLWDAATVNRQPSVTSYLISCDRANMTRMLNELAGVWDKVSEKSLSIDAVGEDRVTVNSVTLAQVASLIASPDLPSRVASARQFAETNAQDPGAATTVGQESIKIPKPSLTSPEFDKAAAASVENRTDKVTLTIKVLGAE